MIYHESPAPHYVFYPFDGATAIVYYKGGKFILIVEPNSAAIDSNSNAIDRNNPDLQSLVETAKDLLLDKLGKTTKAEERKKEMEETKTYVWN